MKTATKWDALRVVIRRCTEVDRSMAEIEDLTLHYLRPFDEKLDRMADDMREIKGRIGILEHQPRCRSGSDRSPARQDRKQD